MHLQAGIYNSALQSVSLTLEAWKSDSDNYSKKIVEAQQRNQAVAGMQVAHGKQLQRIIAVEKLIDCTHNYIMSMEAELASIKQMQQLNYSQPESRTRICDMPVGDTERHLEVIELLQNIQESLTKNIY
ncbi:MAG: hypothetical protein EAZ13_01130 [Sphingobacteriia bacterium]|nr:MAG: hypothetical protein EAZ35_00545 [Sphingobacteriia bacterium]TAH09375.1 MAG: hypothetical protein EAZ13_01130 [Sphingobacteriia bacterium]